MVGIYLLNIIVLLNVAVANIDLSHGITKPTEPQSPHTYHILGFRSLIARESCGKLHRHYFNAYHYSGKLV